MSQNLMSQLVKYEKACCIYGYFSLPENAEKSAQELANHLGVTPQTIRKWWMRMAEGEVTCGYGATGHNGCLYKFQNMPQNTPPDDVA